jgi:hypothetical protein
LIARELGVKTIDKDEWGRVAGRIKPSIETNRLS